MRVSEAKSEKRKEVTRISTTDAEKIYGDRQVTGRSEHELWKEFFFHPVTLIKKI